MPASTLVEDLFARTLPEMAIGWQAETVENPRLLVLNDRLAGELGLDAEWLRSPDGLRFLVGNVAPTGAGPVAQAYAGHQFGGFVPRLGDGRALLVGELTDTGGHLRDLHLKGSGRTPFARGGDGLAAVGPMLREYVVSEAMHALGVPTTRSLAVLATGRQVQRDTALPGAVLARIASSHLRVGSFQFAALTGDAGLLRRLADHAIARHYPAAAQAERPYLALFEAVIAAQAALVAQWMLVGFVHGVMNTDNMTISGETIDYGPCAFIEAYDPRHRVQLDRPVGPLRVRQPAGGGHVEPRPIRRDPAASDRRGSRRRDRRGHGIAGRVPRALRRRLVRGHARQARPARR